MMSELLCVCLACVVACQGPLQMTGIPLLLKKNLLCVCFACVVVCAGLPVENPLNGDHEFEQSMEFLTLCVCNA